MLIINQLTRIPQEHGPALRNEICAGSSKQAHTDAESFCAPVFMTADPSSLSLVPIYGPAARFMVHDHAPNHAKGTVKYKLIACSELAGRWTLFTCTILLLHVKSGLLLLDLCAFPPAEESNGQRCDEVAACWT